MPESSKGSRYSEMSKTQRIKKGGEKKILSFVTSQERNISLHNWVPFGGVEEVRAVWRCKETWEGV